MAIKTKKTKSSKTKGVVKKRKKLLVEPKAVVKQTRLYSGEKTKINYVYVRKAKDLNKESLDCSTSTGLAQDKIMMYNCASKQFFLEPSAAVLNPFNGIQPELFTPTAPIPLPTGVSAPNASYYMFDIDTSNIDLDLTSLAPLPGVIPWTILRFRKIAWGNDITFNDGVVNYTFVDKIWEFIKLVFDWVSYYII